MKQREFKSGDCFMENEIWKDVVGYEGLYKVSNNGDIVSIKGKRNN